VVNVGIAGVSVKKDRDNDSEKSITIWGNSRVCPRSKTPGYAYAS